MLGSFSNIPTLTNADTNKVLTSLRFQNIMEINLLKGGVGKFEKPARDTLFVIFHGMLLTSR